MYEVEAIIDKKLDETTNKEFYLIKWKGYDQEYSSWEPYQHLDHCQELLEVFEREYGGIKTTALGKVYIPLPNTNTTHHEPYPKSSKTTRIKKQPKPHLNNPNLQPQSPVPLTPKRTQQTSYPYHEYDEKMIPISKLSLERGSGSGRRKGSIADVVKLHRRSSIDQWAYQRSNFHVVRKRGSENDMEDGINSHNRRRLEREIDTSYPKNFTPILVSTRSTRRHPNLQQPSPQPQPTQTQNSFQMLEQSSQQIPVPQPQPRSLPQIVAQITSQSQSQPQPQPQNSAPIQTPKQQIDIIGMRRAANGKLQFYVGFGQRKSQPVKRLWMDHQEVFENYTKELCRFYQRSLVLD